MAGFKHGRRPHNWKHGRTETLEFYIWKTMRSRCSNPKTYGYKYYGARGIKVCERWLHSFENFLEDMGVKPQGHTLDRINPDGNYTPDNCRWATVDQQANNKRNNIFFEKDGKRLTVAQWSKITGIDEYLVRTRIYFGWSIERAIFQPVRNPKRYNLDGELLTASALENRFHVCRATLRNRLNRGLTLRQALGLDPVQPQRRVV